MSSTGRSLIYRNLKHFNMTKLEELSQKFDWISRDGNYNHDRYTNHKVKTYKRPKYKVTDLKEFKKHYPYMSGSVATKAFNKSFDSKGYVHVYDFYMQSDDVVNFVTWEL